MADGIVTIPLVGQPMACQTGPNDDRGVLRRWWGHSSPGRKTTSWSRPSVVCSTGVRRP